MSKKSTTKAINLLLDFLLKWEQNWISEKKKKKLISKKKKDPYRRMFFSGVNILSVLLLVVGFWGAFLIIASDDGNPYQAIALIIVLIWCVIFLRYFVWAVYHYNINFGLTDEDWDKIYKAREDKELGISVAEGAPEEPLYNPYRSQTFGLPPGTVRGMIAFTLLFGAIALTVVSMGMKSELNENAFFWDHFEFFKTAFLMMVAFYFGDRSLKYLSKRWPRQSSAIRRKKDETASDDVQEDDESFEEEDQEFAEDTGQPTSIPAKKASPTILKKLLQKEDDEPKPDEIAEEYKQIRDNEFSKYLNDEDLDNVLKTEDLNIELPVLKAIIAVESSGSGFLKDGRAKILFEGHKFWYWLKELGEDPESKVQHNEDILYPTWTRIHYKGGVGEYERFYKAMNINQQAAIYSASWGKFQILGENIDKKIGFIFSRLYDEKNDAHQKSKDDYYLNYLDFYEKQQKSERYHLLDFIAFINSKKVDGKPIIHYIAGKDEAKYLWSKFAYGYNGPGFKRNNYDSKLKKAYERFKNV